jgi:hypothetical protein
MIRVERRASGDASSVMASRLAGLRLVAAMEVREIVLALEWLAMRLQGSNAARELCCARQDSWSSKSPRSTACFCEHRLGTRWHETAHVSAGREPLNTRPPAGTTTAGAGCADRRPWATLAPIVLWGLRLRWGEFSVLDKRVTNAEACAAGNHQARVASLTGKIQCVTVAGAGGAPRAHGPSHVPASREEHCHDCCQPDRP